MRTIQRTFVGALALAIVAGGPWAADLQAQQQGNPHRPDPERERVEEPIGSIFSTETIQVIRDYYGANPRVNVEALPPGIRRNLARGKPLPPGIAKRALPADLRSRVQVPDGYDVVEVGLDVLLVETATGLIRDVISNVIGGR